MAEAIRKSYVMPALGVWVLQLALTVFGVMQTFLEAFDGDSCGPGLCDYDAFWVACNTYYVGALVLLAASPIGIVALRRRGRLALPPPILGAVMVVVLLVATYAAERAAFQLPFSGNRI